MFCWSCGHKNPDNNKFCGECGQVQLRPEMLSHRPDDEPLVQKSKAEDKNIVRSEIFGESTAEKIGKTALPPVLPVETEESRKEQIPVKTTKPAPVDVAPAKPQPEAIEKESKKEEASPDAPATFAPPLMPAIVVPPASKRDPEPMTFRSSQGFHDLPVQEKQTPGKTPTAANRIHGPSFLGLSDEPNTSSGGEYLLDDEYEQPGSRSWRGWFAVALLLVFGILAYRQWNYMKATASELAKTTGIMNPNYGSQPTTVEAPKEPAAQQEEAQTSIESDAAKAEASESAKKKEDSPKPVEPEQSSAANSANENDAGGADESADSVAKPENDAPAAKPSPKHAARDEEETRAHRVDNAPLLMAQNYLQGRNGYQQDCSRGMSILRSAAKEPNAKARIQMAALYASGTCVMQNRPEAYYWFARAQEIEPRNTWIERNLNRLWEDMTDEERRRAER